MSVALGRLDEIMPQRPITEFIRHHYRHFNAAALVDAAEGYARHLDSGGKMMVTLAGAMSTAELGLSLAEMIRQDKVHAISCTGANLEEDIFNLVAHDHYERVPHYRDLTPQDEQALLERHLNRVTDTCIPEEEAMRRIERAVLEEWHAADRSGERYFPHEFMYQLLRSGELEAVLPDRPEGQLAARRLREEPADLRARLGGLDARQHVRRARASRGDVKNVAHGAHRHRVHDRAGRVVPTRRRRQHSIGFFQIGGGIAGDFPICVVPMLTRTCGCTDVPLLGLLLPDQRLDHELRLLLRRRAEREDHLGQARRRHAEVHHRVRRHHRRAADLRLRAGAVTPVSAPMTRATMESVASP